MAHDAPPARVQRAWRLPADLLAGRRDLAGDFLSVTQFG